MRIVQRTAAILAFAALTLLATAVAHAGVLIEIDKEAQRLTVSVDGVQRYHWKVSTGRSGHETPDGEFRPFRLEEDHYSKEWDDAPMPHSIFFTRQGHAIHGSSAVKKLGMPASAGCVRLAPDNASVLFALVKEKGLNNVKVVISGDEPTIAVSNEPSPRVTRQPLPPLRARVWPDDELERRALENYSARMRQRYYQDYPRRTADPFYDPPPRRMATPRYYQAPRGYQYWD